MKKKRHEKILELIRDFDIETQEELLARLEDAGFVVTQATISRDIKELGLVKTSSQLGGYKYVARKNETHENLYKFHAIFKESVLHVDHVSNIAVIKCFTGMANAACAAIDAMNWKGVVGTLAGDDTIFVLCRSDAVTTELVGEINTLLSQKQK